MSDTVFLAPTEKTMTISAADQDRILTDLIRFEIAALEQTRAVAPARSRELAEAESDREEAVLATLRDAFWLRDRGVAEAPIRATAARLGLTLDAADPDWPCLASAATRTLIDIVEERVRRDRGHYAEPLPVFRRALGRKDRALASVPARAGDLAGAFASGGPAMPLAGPAMPVTAAAPAATQSAARAAPVRTRYPHRPSRQSRLPRRCRFNPRRCPSRSRRTLSLSRRSTICRPRP